MDRGPAARHPALRPGGPGHVCLAGFQNSHDSVSAMCLPFISILNEVFTMIILSPFPIVFLCVQSTQLVSFTGFWVQRRHGQGTASPPLGLAEITRSGTVDLMLQVNEICGSPRREGIYSAYERGIRHWNWGKAVVYSHGDSHQGLMPSGSHFPP